MSLFDAVERDLSKLPEDLSESALGELARTLARELDSSANSATSKSMNARALLDTLDKLRSLAPPAKEEDELDELRERRERRRGSAT